MTYRLHGIFVAIALALSAGVAHAQEATGDLVPYVDTQLVGFTTTTVTGDAGVLGMTNACHLEFPATRMCSSEEVMNTVAMPVLPADTDAWVRPVYSFHQSSVSTGNNLTWRESVLDLSGTLSSWANSTAQTQTCAGWRSANGVYSGLAVSDMGGFTGRSCDSAQPVACCARIIVVPEPAASLQLGTGILSLAALSGRAACGS